MTRATRVGIDYRKTISEEEFGQRVFGAIEDFVKSQREKNDEMERQDTQILSIQKSHAQQLKETAKVENGKTLAELHVDLDSLTLVDLSGTIQRDLTGFVPVNFQKLHEKVVDGTADSNITVETFIKHLHNGLHDITDVRDL